MNRKKAYHMLNPTRHRASYPHLLPSLATALALILLLGYVLLLGGTFNGLVLYRLNLIS